MEIATGEHTICTVVQCHARKISLPIQCDKKQSQDKTKKNEK